MPIRGTQLYISDRSREVNLRTDILQQLNEHTQMLQQVQTQILQEQ